MKPKDEIDPSDIDGFLGLTASSLTIYKPKLNKTLPYYSFQTRMAYAAIVERPVAYERKNDTYVENYSMQGIMITFISIIWKIKQL